jgi:hypothetical protein
MVTGNRYAIVGVITAPFVNWATALKRRGESWIYAPSQHKFVVELTRKRALFEQRKTCFGSIRKIDAKNTTEATRGACGQRASMRLNMDLHMANPNPMPVLLVVKKGSRIRVAVCGSIPVPESSASNDTRESSALQRTRLEK